MFSKLFVLATAAGKFLLLSYLFNYVLFIYCLTVSVIAAPLPSQSSIVTRADSPSLNSIFESLGSNGDLTSALSSLDSINSQDSKPSKDELEPIVNKLTSAFKSTNQQVQSADTSNVDSSGLGKYLADDLKNIVDHLSPTLNSVVGDDLGLSDVLKPLDKEITATIDSLETDLTNIQDVLYGALKDLGLEDVGKLLQKVLNGELPGLLTSIDKDIDGILQKIPVVGSLTESLGL